MPDGFNGARLSLRHFRPDDLEALSMIFGEDHMRSSHSLRVPRARKVCPSSLER